jgi:hypothetical protein
MRPGQTTQTGADAHRDHARPVRSNSLSGWTLDPELVIGAICFWKLLVERLALTDAAAHELRPGWDRNGTGLWLG